MAYDAKYNLLYIGTGNGTPWNQKIRSPGGGDNLFVCSIIAVDADTGEYRWHYQGNPGETWDYNAAMDIELATMTIGGAKHDVILHAPKNGFFYVIDRKTGHLLSAKPIVPMNWASGMDANGRPVENFAARYPTAQGFGHEWDYRAQQWRVLAFALDGQDKLPPPRQPDPAIPDNAAFQVDPALAKAGAGAYAERCAVCHGATALSGGAAPDLLQSAVPLDPQTFAGFVQGGALVSRGMPAFGKVPTGELIGIAHYLRRRAREVAKAQKVSVGNAERGQ